MMLIDINTEKLLAAVQQARAANEAITEAANLLNTVVIHNDWQCPERSEINNNTNRNRSQVLTLQTDAEQLYAGISYTADAFVAAEQEIANSFNDLDNMISSFLSKTPVNAQSQKDLDASVAIAKDLLQDFGAATEVIGNPLSVSNFDVLTEGFQGA